MDLRAGLMALLSEHFCRELSSYECLALLTKVCLLVQARPAHKISVCRATSICFAQSPISRRPMVPYTDKAAARLRLGRLITRCLNFLTPEQCNNAQLQTCRYRMR